MVQCDGEMSIERVTTDGKVSFHQSVTKGESVRKMLIRALGIRMCLRDSRRIQMGLGLGTLLMVSVIVT